MARIIGSGARYGDTGALPAAHSDATGHMTDVAGPPAPASRAPGVPMAGPTTRPAPVGGPQPAQKGGGRTPPGGLYSGPNGPAQRGGGRSAPGGIK